MSDVWVSKNFVHCVNLIQYFEQFELLDLNCLGNNIQKCMWIVIIWGILNHRNRIIFNNTVMVPI